MKTTLGKDGLTKTWQEAFEPTGLCAAIVTVRLSLHSSRMRGWTRTTLTPPAFTTCIPTREEGEEAAIGYMTDVP